MQARGALLAAFLLAAASAFGADAGVDGLGRPLAPGVGERLERLERSARGRPLAAADRDFLLTLLNSPELDGGPFKDREALVRHFLSQGVRASVGAGAGFEGSDLWRLVSAARAAGEAFRIPPAVLVCLTFRESSFDRKASAWTTTAKGVGQMTNPAVADVIARIRSNPDIRNGAEAYVRLLGARLPDRVEGAPDVDALTAEVRRLEASGAPASLIAEKKRARSAAIASHKDEPGHIYNLETNFGLASAYLAYLRRHRFPEVADEEKGWLTAVGAYNQGAGVANELIYGVFRGAADYNAQPLDAVFSEQALARLGVSADRRRELAGEVGSVRRCASRSSP